MAGFSRCLTPEVHTALALGTLANVGMTAADTPVRRGVEWLLGRRLADGSWSGGPFPYPDTDSYRDFNATQDVYATAEVLAAFARLHLVEN